VQTVYRLGQSEALRLTTARWYTPSGRLIQKPMTEQPLMAAEQGEGGSVLAGADTNEIFLTDGGREVRGGGGIRPDVTVYPDTLTDVERNFYRALGAKLPMYQDVMTSYALELKGEGTITDPSFQVTDQMRRDIINRLAEREVEVPTELLAGAGDLIERQLGYEIQRYVFGRQSESLRRLQHDRQVERTIEFLRQATSVPELLALAAAEQEPADEMN
jgi:carboxyl-terminal processing protease